MRSVARGSAGSGAAARPRLLPKGWRRDGPNAEATAPVGIGNDLDFTAGGDTVSFAIPLDNDAPAVTVAAMYDAAAKVPELVGVAQRLEDR